MNNNHNPFGRRGFSRLFTLAFALFLTVSLQAQDITLKVSGTTIREVIEKLQKDYGYSFSINSSEVDVNKKVSISVSDADIRTVLDKVFAGTPVTFKIDGKLISVTEASVQQNVRRDKVAQISGSVVDEFGEPVPGAAVLIKGTKTGTSTDLDGNFTMKVTGNPVLEVSFLGMATKEVAVTDPSKPILITMGADTDYLEDVVIVAYGSQRRELVTNAIASFKPDENNGRTALSPSEMLQGRIAGVSVATSSGNLGTSERMSIRGSSSLSASNEPLYVIDGIPLNNESGSLYSLGEDLSSLSVLNLSDIESIEVLKDAASAAIYGSRATNGVILITTKQGREGKSEVKVNYNFGVSEFNNRNRINYADSDSWVRIYNEAIDNYNRQNGFIQTSTGYVQHIRNPYDGLPDTDWLSVATRLGLSHSTDVSFTGGTNKTKIYVGGNFAYQEGVIKTNDITKINLKANLSHKMNSWLEVGANMSGNFIKNNRVPGAGIGSTIVARMVEQRPFDRPYKPSGDYYLGGTDELSRHNPVQILNEETAYVNQYRYLGALWAQAQLLDGLKFKASFNTDAGYTFDYLYYNSNHPYKEDNGRIIEKNRFLMTNLIETFLTYDKQWGDFTFGAMGGHSYQKTSSRANSIDAQNFPTPSFDTIGVAAVISGVTGGLSEYAMESWYGRVNMAWKDRYIFNATLRADGSSRFAPDCRWGYFPSASLGWNVSKEDFWESPETELKVRASYGKTGNQDGISNYGWQPLISGGANYGGISGIAISSKGNENLTWETADQYDAGFDLSFLKGKVSMMFDVYLKDTHNLLYNMPMHSTSGQTSMLSNIGSMRNKGIEFTLNTHMDIGKVHWSSSFNISHNENTLTKLVGDDIVNIGSNHALKVGEEVGSFYLLRWDGIYQYDGEVPSGEYGMGVRAGDMKYYDADGNGIINDSDKVITGSPNPDFAGGWNNSFSWKGWNLSVFFTYSYGADIYAQWMTGPTRMGNYQGLLQEWCDNRWTGPGSTNKYPRPVYSYHGNNSRASTYYMKDGSFVKLKSLMLSYSLPQKVTDMIKVKNARIYLQGENLALFSKYPGWDPEISNSTNPSLIGCDNYGVPTPRIYKLGVNISF